MNRLIGAVEAFCCGYFVMQNNAGWAALAAAFAVYFLTRD